MSLTDRAFLAGEEDTAVAAVCVGYADVVPICPVEFSERGRQRENFDLFSAHTNLTCSLNAVNRPQNNTHKLHNTNLIAQCMAKLQGLSY